MNFFPSIHPLHTLDGIGWNLSILAVLLMTTTWLTSRLVFARSQRMLFTRFICSIVAARKLKWLNSDSHRVRRLRKEFFNHHVPEDRTTDRSLRRAMPTQRSLQ